MDHLDNRATSEPNASRRRESLALADRMEEIGSFPRQVKALRCCGLLRLEVDGRPARMACNLRFCPACQPRWRHRTFLSWMAKIEAIRGESGDVMTLTLTCPSVGDTPAAQKANLRGWFTRLFRKHAWKGAAGFIHRVGVLLVTELGKENEDSSQPHAHLLLAAAAPGEAAAAARWLLEEWLALVPGSSPHGQNCSACEGPDGAAPWLNYILKGDMLDPAWGDERLEATARVLIDGSHRVRVLGLLRGQKGMNRRASIGSQWHRGD